MYLPHFKKISILLNLNSFQGRLVTNICTKQYILQNQNCKIKVHLEVLIKIMTVCLPIVCQQDYSSTTRWIVMEKMSRWVLVQLTSHKKLSDPDHSNRVYPLNFYIFP